MLEEEEEEDEEEASKARTWIPRAACAFVDLNSTLESDVGRGEDDSLDQGNADEDIPLDSNIDSLE